MRKWLMPSVLLFILIMLDMAVLPIFFTGIYVLPLALVLIICIGASYGRMHGMLYGMIGGLLIDILVSYPLGMRTFQYIAAGFLSGLIVYVADDDRRTHGFKPAMFALRLALFSAAFFLLSEAVTCVYQYFNTALFEARFAVNSLIRVLVGTALVMALYVPFTRIMLGRRSNATSGRPSREVKFF